MNVNSAPTKGKLITCILPEGEGHSLLEKLKSQKNVVTASLHHARGSGLAGAKKRKGFITEIKKDMVTVAVSSDIADDIFTFIFFEANLNRPHVGIVYMEKLSGFVPITPYVEAPESSTESS